jgi:hypothetical protein
MLDLLRITLDRNARIPFNRIAAVWEICTRPRHSDREVFALLESMQIAGAWSGPNDSVWIGDDCLYAGRLSIEFSDSFAAAPATLPVKLRGIRVHRVGNSIFIPLPPALWRPTDPDPCRCSSCKGATPGYWDTLAVFATEPSAPSSDMTWMPHGPQFLPAR